MTRLVLGLPVLGSFYPLSSCIVVDSYFFMNHIISNNIKGKEEEKLHRGGVVLYYYTKNIKDMSSIIVNFIS